MAPAFGQWRFVRQERHGAQRAYTALFGFGRTTTFTTIIRMLQERLVEKYLEKLSRRGRFSSLAGAVDGTNEQLERITPLLAYRACRAKPLSFLKSELAITALQDRVRDATDQIRERSH